MKKATYNVNIWEADGLEYSILEIDMFGLKMYILPMCEQFSTWERMLSDALDSDLVIEPGTFLEYETETALTKYHTQCGRHYKR